MPAPKHRRSEKPRELRRRVVLPARLRWGAQWSDICILNISSRGLLIHAPWTPAEGSLLELRRGDHVIAARVIWKDGARIGLRAEERIPIEEILSAGQSNALRLTAMNEPITDRRKRPRRYIEDARLEGRTMEFVSVGVIAAISAVTIWSIAQEALAQPMEVVLAALGG